MASTMPLCLFAAVALYERRAGHARALGVAIIGHISGTVLIALAFAPLALTHVPMLVRAADNVDYGGSMVIAASLGALAGLLHDRRVSAVVFAVALAAIAVHHQMSDWGHLAAIPLGYALGRATDGARARRIFFAITAATVVIVAFVALAA
jgi:hypothetical protein